MEDDWESGREKRIASYNARMERVKVMRRRQELKPALRDSLLAQYRGNAVPARSAEDIAKLLYAQTLDADGHLTEIGICLAIERMMPVEQYQEMALTVTEIPVADIRVPQGSVGRSDLKALLEYRRRGYSGMNSEGHDTFTIIQGLILDSLDNPRGLTREHMLSGFLDNQLESNIDRLDELVSGALVTPQAQWELNIQDSIKARAPCELFELRSYYRNLLNLDAEVAVRIARALPREKWIALLRFIAQDPQELGKGWPDLTLLKDGAVEFTEVKAKDKLMWNQIRVLRALQRVGGIRVSITLLIEQDR